MTEQGQIGYWLVLLPIESDLEWQLIKETGSRLGDRGGK